MLRWLEDHPRPAMWLVVAIAAGMAIVRYFDEPPSLNIGQTDNYWPLANNLLDGRGYSLCYPLYFPFCGPDNQATAMREPVPALFFAACAWLTGRSLELTTVSQALIFLVTLLLLYAFISEWLGRAPAFLAALLWATSLPVIKLLPQLSGDLMGALFVVCSSWALLRACRAGHLEHVALAAVFLGMGILSRSALLVLALPWFAAVVVSARQRAGARPSALRGAAVFTGALVLVLSPWVVRNQITFGVPLAGTSMNGYNVFRNSHQVGAERYLRFIGHQEADSLVKALVARRTGLTGRETEAQMDRVYMEEGLARIKAHPLRYAVLSIWRFIPLWTNWGVNQGYGKKTDVFDRLVLFQQVFLLVFLVVGVKHTGWRSWPWFAAIVLECLAYMALVAQVRYLVPMLPLMMGFAGAGLLAALHRWAGVPNGTGGRSDDGSASG